MASTPSMPAGIAIAVCLTAGLVGIGFAQYLAATATAEPPAPPEAIQQVADCTIYRVRRDRFPDHDIYTTICPGGKAATNWNTTGYRGRQIPHTQETTP